MARALEWHSRGSEFESHHLHFLKNKHFSKLTIIIIFILSSLLPLFSDTTEDSSGDDYIGNKWYSKQNFYSHLFFESGLSGTKDYIKESFLFKYSFMSRDRHQFNIRFYHLGFSTGIYTNNFSYYNFALLAGFEYLYKIFGNMSGVYCWLDIGGCNQGFSFNTGFGIGDRFKDFIELEIDFLQNISLFTMLNFNFFLFNFFNINGKIGIDMGFSNLKINFFSFKTGFFIGFTVRNIFKIEFGGGFTLNDYLYFGGFGALSLLLSL